MSPTRIQVVIFDVDGVLITTGPFTRQLAREHGITPDQVRPFFARDFPACLIGRADLRAGIEPWLGPWGWTAGPDAFLDFWFSAETPTAADQELFPLVARMRAAGFVCAVATNQERHRLTHLRTRLGFATRFDHIFASCELSCTKPDAEFFGHVEARLAPLRPAELLFFDDRAENIAAARARGWSAEIFTGLPALVTALHHHGITV